jgi:hypothetical protein
VEFSGLKDELRNGDSQMENKCAENIYFPEKSVIKPRRKNGGIWRLGERYYGVSPTTVRRHCSDKREKT